MKVDYYCRVLVKEALSEELKRKVEDLDQDDFPFPWSRESWESFWEKKEEGYLLSVIIGEDPIIGFSLFLLSKDDSLGHLQKIVVSRNHRKKGLGQFLLKDCLKYLNALDMKRLILEVEVKNDPAIKLYKSLSFEIIHRVEKFYSNGQDAFIMERHN